MNRHRKLDAVKVAGITRLLPSEAHAAALAREAIGELEPLLGSRLSPTVRLLVSDILTNSVGAPASA